jgi:hypothetical protein
VITVRKEHAPNADGALCCKCHSKAHKYLSSAL